MNRSRLAGWMMLGLLLPPLAHAHFIWLVRQADGADARLHLYFGEAAEPDDPDLLPRVQGAVVWRIPVNGDAEKIVLKQRDASLFAPVPDGPALFVARHDLGVLTRGEETFALRYYAKTGPPLGEKVWAKVDCGKYLDLDLIPERQAGKVQLRVVWQGKPAAAAQVVIRGPGLDDLELEADRHGEVRFTPGRAGLYSIRARHLDATPGEHDGQKYSATRHYVTLALPMTAVPPAGDSNAASPAPPPQVAASPTASYPPLPEAVTSFGAAIADSHLYVYGGHTGGAHAYSNKTQAQTLYCLDLKRPEEGWKSLGTGPGLQGLAMVSHRGRVYRLGGFMAKNAEGEEHDLWSQGEVACFDPESGKWSQLPPLPEPRSSFDAAVVGNHLYVVGGWKLAGDAETVWHRTAHALDLSAEKPQWEALPEPPFQRRALAVAAHAGKLYVLGGMQRAGEPTTRVDLFDPAHRAWSAGPNLQGQPMDGFGAAAFEAGGRLYASTYSGKLQRLAADGKSWEVVRQLERARFFHRMLPLSASQLIVLGGASMESGKFPQLDVLQVE